MSANRRLPISTDTKLKLLEILKELEQTSDELQVIDGEHKTISLTPDKIQTHILRCYHCLEDVEKQYVFHCYDVTDYPDSSSRPPALELDWHVGPDDARKLIECMLQDCVEFCITRKGDEYDIRPLRVGQEDTVKPLRGYFQKVPDK